MMKYVYLRSDKEAKSMKKTHLTGVFLLAATLFLSCSHKPWQLVWEDDFNEKELDPSVWRRTDRGTPDWQNTQSHDPRCLDLRDGLLVLRGIENDDLEKDTAHFLTGGVVTQYKLPLPSPGRYEVKARLHGARGAWPAIWLLPYDFDSKGWPQGGEIDIMERLNNDTIAYQTIHSNWIEKLGQGENPPHGKVGPINQDDFNLYAVDILTDSLVLSINGKTILSYPRIPGKEESGQYPFLVPQFLLIDMQLGGGWIGEVHPEDLPVEMEVDWVRVYRPKK